MENQLSKTKRNKLNKGYVHVYTGNGKGKTTAALGLAIRAAGAGLQVLFIQFIKGKVYSETIALKMLSKQTEMIASAIGKLEAKGPKSKPKRATKK